MAHFVVPPGLHVAAAATARIGDAAPVVAANSASQTPNLARGATGDYYESGLVPPLPQQTDDELLASAQSVVGGVRTLFGGGGSGGGGLSGWLTGISGVRAPAPPRLILPADLGRWPPLREAFPVFVNYPGFGAGLATRFLTLQTGAGLPAGLYLAVKKFAPLGPLPSEPFSLGYYAVPAWMVQRVPLAVAQLFPAENVVVVDDMHGRQFSVEFVTFRTTADPRYELARRMLILQYPYALTDMFATRLMTSAPPEMQPGGMLPPRLTEMPPVLAAPSQTTQQR